MELFKKINNFLVHKFLKIGAFGPKVSNSLF